MEPISKYYLKDGVFYLRNKLPRRIRIIVSILFMCFSVLFANNEGYSFQPTFSQVKQDRIEVIASMPGVNGNDARQIITSIYKWSKEFQVDEKLILAIAKVESSFNKYAISKSGAYGIMQVIPLWHKEKIIQAKKVLGNPELFNIDTNIYLGTWILKDCLNKHKTTEPALKCYSGNTEGYTKKVLLAYKGL